MSVVSVSASFIASSLMVAFLIFWSAASAGRKSAGAAAITSASQRSVSGSSAASISSTVFTSIRSTPYGVFSVEGPVTSVTCAPRSRAALAIEKPIRPLERLPM